MLQLILTACFTDSADICAPVLLAAGEAGDLAACEAGAARIVDDWVASRPDLIAGEASCRPTADLPALALNEIAPGVHVHAGTPVQLEDSSDGRIANLGVVIGTASVAVIDTGVSRRQGDELFTAIRKLTDLPVSHVILTHMHPDHVLGSGVFREAGASVIGHEALPLALELRAPGYLEAITSLYPPEVVLGTEVVLPDKGVADRLDIDLGGRVLKLRAQPTAHTDNDLTVFDSVTGTLFAGDLVFRELTPVVDGSLLGWVEWTDTTPEPAPTLVVPGHGPVATEWREAVAAQDEFLKALAEATRTRISAGMPMSEAVPAIVNDMEFIHKMWNSFSETVARDATAAYKELEWE